MNYSVDKIDLNYTNKWKSALDNIKNIYSNTQIGVILGLSHSSVTHRLNHFNYSSYGDKILEINKKLSENNDPRTIFFLEWCNRLLKNRYGLLFRIIRNELNLSNKKLDFKKSYINLFSYENGSNIMPEKLYKEFLNHLEKKGYNYDELYIKKDEDFITNQIKLFLRNKFYLKCPSLINLLPSLKTLKGIESEYKVYNKIKRLFPNTFLGCTFSRDLKKKEDIDILTIYNNKILVMEIKDYKQYKQCNRRRLRYLNNRLKKLREEYSEITRTIAILPSINIPYEVKILFERNGNLLLDKRDFTNLNKEKLLNFNNKKPLQNELKQWLEEHKLSLNMLNILFKMFGINKTIRNEDSFNKAKLFIKEIEQPINTLEKRQLLFLINKYVYFYDEELLVLKKVRRLLGISLSKLCLDLFGDRNLNKNKISTMETGKKRCRHTRTLYVNYIKNKIKNRTLIKKADLLVNKEKERWSLAKEFPMVVGLANESNYNLENVLYKKLKKQGYKVLKNALINDKNLSRMTLNFHHPEADIITKKDDFYTLISCKETFNEQKNTQFLLECKSEIDKISKFYDMEFSKIILAVKADLTNITWKNLENYAKEKNVELLKGRW